MPSLNERYADLLQSGPIRVRDAAQRLGTTEAALVAAGVTGAATPLKTEWGALFAAMPRLGGIMCLTRNEHAVHERHGHFVDVSSGPGHILVLGPDIDLRLFPGRWAHAYALGGERPSIQIFDKDGNAAHKIFATGETDKAGSRLRGGPGGAAGTGQAAGLRPAGCGAGHGAAGAGLWPALPPSSRPRPDPDARRRCVDAGVDVPSG